MFDVVLNFAVNGLVIVIEIIILVIVLRWLFDIVRDFVRGVL